jgi:hypothetical protein
MLTGKPLVHTGAIRLRSDSARSDRACSSDANSFTFKHSSRFDEYGTAEERSFASERHRPI